MIVVNVLGGLGNQLFQYAFGKALAKRRGYSVAFDLKDFEWYSRHEGPQLSKVGAHFRQASDSELAPYLGWQHWRWARRFRLYKALPRPNTIIEPHTHFSEKCFGGEDDRYYVGTWQSERYFGDYASELRAELISSRIDLSAYPEDLLDKVVNKNSVAIHVRRGDYVANWRASRRVAQCGSAYYIDAIALIRKYVSDPVFIVFSDEPNSSEIAQLVPQPFTMVNPLPRMPAYVELMLMRKCKHFVIANSTFSWWGAWLAEQPSNIVVAPRKWFAHPSRSTKDLLPTSWVTAG